MLFIWMISIVVWHLAWNRSAKNNFNALVWRHCNAVAYPCSLQDNVVYPSHECLRQPTANLWHFGDRRVSFIKGNLYKKHPLSLAIQLRFLRRIDPFMVEQQKRCPAMLFPKQNLSFWFELRRTNCLLAPTWLSIYSGPCSTSSLIKCYDVPIYPHV